VTAQQNEAPSTTQPRFLTLDALRGFAAMAVALFHYHKPFMPGGYLAVDFFFALSGFVLVHSYAHRFEQGLTPSRFIRMRFIRLYPLHLVGVAIGMFFALQRVLRHVPGHMGPGEVIAAILLNPLMLPSPLSQELFPLNDPAWSLFFEMLSNIAMAVALIRLRLRGLLLVAAGAGAALLLAASLTAYQPDSLGIAKSAVDGGNMWASFHIGLCRTAFSFSLGMALARMPTAAIRPARAWALPFCLALLALLALGVGADIRLAYDLAVVFIASPLLILAGSRFEPGRLFAPAARFVGDVSFALYATHLPVAMAFLGLERRLHTPEGALAPLFLATALALAAACNRWVDKPARRSLSRLVTA
jgi:peptidoglycan/LPS O-acetylase OafA/YrhL